MWRLVKDMSRWFRLCQIAIPRNVSQNGLHPSRKGYQRKSKFFRKKHSRLIGLVYENVSFLKKAPKCKENGVR